MRLPSHVWYEAKLVKFTQIFHQPLMGSKRRNFGLDFRPQSPWRAVISRRINISELYWSLDDYPLFSPGHNRNPSHSYRRVKSCEISPMNRFIFIHALMQKKLHRFIFVRVMALMPAITSSSCRLCIFAMRLRSSGFIPVDRTNQRRKCQTLLIPCSLTFYLTSQCHVFQLPFLTTSQQIEVAW